MIKNVLFDLGGVVMDIERMNCVAAFKRLGMADPEEFLGDYAQKGPFMLIEEGLISPDGFRAQIRRLLPSPVADSQIDSAFEEFLIGIPRHRLEAIRELRKRYHTYVLSNTNPIMWNGKIAREFAQEGGSIDDYFDGMVTSFEAKCMKPAARIFRYAIDRLGIKPDETLFLDDSTANLETAAHLGFHTALVSHGTDMTQILARELKS